MQAPRHAAEFVRLFGERVRSSPSSVVWAFPCEGPFPVFVQRHPDDDRLPLGELFDALLDVGAEAFVLCHHHPSGDPTPSALDRDQTFYASEVGELLSIRVVDHVVVANAGYCSVIEEAVS